jgi:hypothetical protein
MNEYRGMIRYRKCYNSKTKYANWEAKYCHLIFRWYLRSNGDFRILTPSIDRAESEWFLSYEYDITNFFWETEGGNSVYECE